MLYLLDTLCKAVIDVNLVFNIVAQQLELFCNRDYLWFSCAGQRDKSEVTADDDKSTTSYSMKVRHFQSFIYTNILYSAPLTYVQTGEQN